MKLWNYFKLMDEIQLIGVSLHNQKALIGINSPMGNNTQTINVSPLSWIIQGKIAERAEQMVKLNAVGIFLANKIKSLEKDSPELLIKKEANEPLEDLPF